MSFWLRLFKDMRSNARYFRRLARKDHHMRKRYLAFAKAHHEAAMSALGHIRVYRERGA